MDDGITEWWAFKCKGLECDFEMSTDGLPKKYEEAWNKGQRL